MTVTTINSLNHTGVTLSPGRGTSDIVSITSKGEISTSGYAVLSVGDGDTTVVNDGTIHATTAAVYVQYGAITNAAYIYGGLNAVFVNNGVTFTNTATGRVGGGKVIAVAADYGGYINNQGKITASGIGVSITTLSSAANIGSISGGVAGAVIVESSIANAGVISGGTQGVYLDLGTVTNTGKISGGVEGAYLLRGTLTNTGSISGGIGVLGIVQTVASPLLLTNAGSITGTDGISFDYGAVVNEAGGVISGSQWGAILKADSAPTGPAQGVVLKNYGHIEGQTGGVYLDGVFKASGGGGGVIVQAAFINYGTVMGGTFGVGAGSIDAYNHGLISGNAIGVSLTTGDLTNAGTIAGGSYAVLAQEELNLSIASGAVFSGKVADLSGNGTLVLYGGSGTLLGLGTSFTGFSEIESAAFSGQNLTLQGDVAGLASGQDIQADWSVITLTGFAATSLHETSTNQSISISNGAVTELISAPQNDPYGPIQFYTENGNTYLFNSGTSLSTYPPAGDDTIVSTSSDDQVAPGQASLAANVTIAAGTTIATPAGAAIYVAARISNANVLVSGGAEAAGIAWGAVFLASGTLVNQGVIVATSTLAAVSMATGGVLDNTGTIVGAVSTKGVYITNSGTIVNNASNNPAVYSNPAVYLDGGGLNNLSQISGGVVAGFAVTTITNEGGIYGAEWGVFDDPYTAAITNTGSIGGGLYGVHLLNGGTIINAGTISGGRFAVQDFGSPLTGQTFVLEAEPGAVFEGGVRVLALGDLLLAGTTAGTLDMGNSFSGFSNISFATGAEWTLEGTATDLAGGQTISGFTAGDTIVLSGIDAQADEYIAGEGLVIYGPGAADALDFAGTLDAASFHLGQYGNSVIITEAVQCFCRGTHLTTDHGEVPVEALQIGDLLRTAAGNFAPVRWVGRRSYNGRFIAGDHLALPVRLHPGALAEGVPARDLYVSPWHGICEGGVLVPAWRLINGVSITQVPAVDQVEYFHIELDQHAVIFAEGAPAETYLDIGDRAQFQTSTGADAPPPGLSPCLPRIEDGFLLARVQAQINARAGLPTPSPTCGPLRGFIDESGPRLRGWAQDTAAPEAAVALEVLCGGIVVLRLLANRYRADLRAAGLGSGCHAFDIALPAGFGARSIRRAADGAILPQGVRDAA